MLCWNLHGLHLKGETNHNGLRQRWQVAFASCPPGGHPADLHLRLDIVPAPPPAPAGPARYVHDDLLAYHVTGDRVSVHLPRYGRLDLDLTAGRTEGLLLPSALASDSLLEDLIAIGLSPHLRRRGLFLIHAFAAAYRGRAVLLVGAMGAGKTTTGLALLAAGWRLLANDSPLVNPAGEILSYPGLLAAYPGSWRRIPTLAELVPAGPVEVPPKKLCLPAETIWPRVWIARAPLAAILFPAVGDRPDHELAPLTTPETLRRLMPHAMERWDRDYIPVHLQLLRRLAEAAPGYSLELGRDVASIAPMLASLLS